MGVSSSTLKLVAPAAFVINVACQIYGMTSKPNMMDIHNKNISFFSPYPWFIAAFFTPQQFIQLAWLYRLWKLDPKKPSERVEFEQQADYVPYYAVGNISIATWMLFWNANNLKASNVCVIINSLTQLFYIAARIPKMNTSSTSSILTHLNAKTFAGIGVLDLLHNGAAAYAVGQQPSGMIKALTGAGFGVGALCSDWIFGGCLVYDLVGLAVGQEGDWRNLLSAYAVGTAAIVVGKNYFRPPYETKNTGYQAARSDEIEDGLA